MFANFLDNKKRKMLLFNLLISFESLLPLPK